LASSLGMEPSFVVLKIALASIVKRYRVELGAGSRIDYAVHPTLQPVGSIPVVLQRQDGCVPTRIRSRNDPNSIRLDE